ADGNATKELLPMSYPFRITYEGATTQVTQDIGRDPCIVFEAIVATARFTDSPGNGIAGGVIEYSADGWKSFGTTGADGNVTTVLLSKSYTFRISCDGATISKVQDIAADPVVEFGTNLTTVRFETPDGTGIPDATVEYNSGGWKPFGTTGADGNATRELLPKSYTFRISYEGMTKSTTQDIGIDPCVVFTTNTTTVRFTDSLGEGIAGGVIEYNAGGWKPFGITGGDGNSTTELIPKSYTFRLTCDGVAITRTQDTAIDPLVVFTTTLATVSFTDSAGNGIPDATVEYYAGGWKPFGATGIDGNATKELLPKSYRFRISYEGVIQEREQDIGGDPVVGFTTTGAIVSFIDSTGNGIPGTAIEYYSGGWNTFGTTGIDGNATKELLPKSYTFRITYDDVMQEREQDIGVDPVVRYRTSLATVRFLASDDNGISGGIAEYYAGDWKSFGTTGVDGDTTRELLPLAYPFRLTYGSGTPEEQVQDIGADPVVVFRAGPIVIRLIDSGGAGLPGGIVRYKDSGWEDFGTTGADGYVTADLPPQEYEIEMGYNGHTLTEILTDPSSPLIFQTGSMHSVSGTCTNYQVTNGWEDFTQDIELLPGEVKFKFSDINGAQKYTVTAGGVIEIH
ncbi:MAG: hypothetical protein JXA08_02285, partial [Methanomicrobiaceae archaeon]|nr:hypothetical protein [Methanomicrobiaceae archaeon]